MNGEQFLGTARFLLTRREGVDADEAAYRSSISRAYYACFITIRDLAYNVCSPNSRKQGQIKEAKKIGHQTLQFWLKNASVEAVRQLGEDLSSLSSIRNDADYNMKEVISVDDAKDAITNAEYLLKTFAGTPEGEIRKAVEAYIEKMNPIL